MPAPTKAQLEVEIVRLKAVIVELEDRVANEQALRVAAEELVTDKDAELEAAREQAVAAAQQAAAAIAAAANQAPAAQNPPEDGDIIPKPRGSGGSTYNVRRAMGLTHDKPKYARCLRIVRDVALASRINWQKDYSHQDPLVLGRLFRAAQEKEPYLARFEASWATADMLKQFMRNRRKYMVRLLRLAGPAPAPGAAVGGAADADADDN